MRNVGFLTDTSANSDIHGDTLMRQIESMKLRDLPDWSKRFGALEQSGRSVLKGAESSTLGHFAVLVIESNGIQKLTLLEVGSGKIDKVLAVLKAHIGRPLDEIEQLEIID